VTVRWRKQVTAPSLAELEAAAERHFRPGTTYSIFSVREETPAGVFLSYRAEAHLLEASGKDSKVRSTARRGGQGGTAAGQGTVRGRSGSAGPDVGPVTGRIIDPAASGPSGAPGGGPGAGPTTPPAAGPVSGSRGAGPAGSPGAGARGGTAGAHAGGPAGGPGVRVPGGGAVAGYNPDTVDEVHGWRPEEIPARVLRGGPGLNAAYALLQDPELDLTPGPAFATEDPEFVSLLDRAAPPEDGRPSNATPSNATPSNATPLNATPLNATPLNATPLNAALRDQDRPAAGVPAASVPIAASPTTGPLQASAEPRLVDQASATGPDAEPPGSRSDERTDRPRTSGRPTVVYVGLLDDPIEAAERCGHRRWSAAGVLNGGRPGASVVCYGLGDGTNVARLAEGLHRYQPMRLVLAVDASRKHADTQAWVRQVAKVVQPSSLVSVARTVTSTPGTVQELGYPVQHLG
jgi:hypothetical protein